MKPRRGYVSAGGSALRRPPSLVLAGARETRKGPLLGGVGGFATRLERAEKEHRGEYGETDHGPHRGVAVCRGELAVKDLDRASDGERPKDEAESAREILHPCRRSLAAERGEREGERLRQRHHDRAGERDQRERDQQGCE